MDNLETAFDSPKIARIVYLLPIVLLVGLSIAHAAALTGKVIGIADGDTIAVLDAAKVQHKIRLAGIDAPEKGQPYGDRSKENLSALVFGKTVTLEGDKMDRYGRRISKVMIDGVDANLAQVKAGLAWHYKAYASEQSSEDRAAYAAAETDSRSSKRGLWKESITVAPWDFRHKKLGNERLQDSKSECACGTDHFCTGSRGGQYCLAPNGKKKYN